jgi:hypothetical protein
MLSKTFYAKKYDLEKNKNYHFHIDNEYIVKFLITDEYSQYSILLGILLILRSTSGNYYRDTGASRSFPTVKLLDSAQTQLRIDRHSACTP